MEEVVAERKKGLFAVYIVFIVFAVAFAAAFTAIAVQFGGIGIAFCAVACAIVVFMIVISVRSLIGLSRTPKVIAVREDHELVFLGERIPLTGIAEVNYHFSRGRYAATQTWGRLTVILTDGRTLSCDFVAHVDRVQDRLLALKYEYAAKGAATNS